MNLTFPNARRFTSNAPRTRSFALLVAAIAALPLTVGCLSEEEKEARRAWAYDLSGEYTEVRQEGVRAGALLIENESSKNDIKVTFTRGELYEKEQELFDLIQDEAKRAQLAETLIIGEGKDELREEFIGGENISDNFGESSKLFVTSDKYEANAKLETAREARVYWTLSAEIVNESDELRGILTIHYQDSRPKNWADEGAEVAPGNDEEGEEEDKRVLHTEAEPIPVVFKRNAGPIEGEVCDDCKTGPSSGSDDEADEGADE